VARLRELGREAGCQTGRNWVARDQQLPDCLNRTCYLFGVLAADPNAITAADAAPEQYLGLAIRYADGLGWALSYAGVTGTAALFDSGYRRVRVGAGRAHGTPPPLYGSDCLPTLAGKVHGLTCLEKKAPATMA
jgi:hypothetical protein